jgi:hypothetical protein
VSCEEVGITFQCHCLGSSPNISRRNEKHGHPRSVGIFPENDASESVEAIGEKCLH